MILTIVKAMGKVALILDRLAQRECNTAERKVNAAAALMAEHVAHLKAAGIANKTASALRSLVD